MDFQIKVNDTGVQKGTVDSRDEVIVTTSEDSVVNGKTVKEETTYKVSAWEFVLSDGFEKFGDPLDRLTRLTASLGRATHDVNVRATPALREMALARREEQEMTAPSPEEKICPAPKAEKKIITSPFEALFDHPLVGPLLSVHPLFYGIRSFLP